MRIDLPCCDFQYCRNCFDGNCMDKNKYSKCYYRYLKNKHEEEKEVVCKCVDRGMDITGEYNIEYNMHCPNCNDVVGDYECIELYFKYCPECGQKMKYTENEE